MKILGCAISILGVILCGISIAVFGVAISKAMEARPVQTIPLEMGNKVSTDLFAVDTSKFCMIALKATVTSGMSTRETGDNDNYNLKFSFPFSYKVIDAGGRVLVTEDTSFADDVGTRSYSNSHVTQDGGTVNVESSYQKFSPPGSGDIRVEVEIHSDETTNAEAANLNLIVYDRVSKHAKSVTSGVLLLVLGGGLAMVGLVLFVVATVRSGNTSPAPPPQAPAG